MSVDVVGRDLETGSTVTLSSGFVRASSTTFAGLAQIRNTRDQPDPWNIPVELVLESSPGPDLEDDFGFQVTESIEGKYLIYSGTVEWEEPSGAPAGAVDVFGISDPVELVLAAMGLGACLIACAKDIWTMKQVFKGYERQGYVANLKTKTSWHSAVTCSFEVEIMAVDPKTNKVVTSQTLKAGLKRRKKK